MEDATFMLRAVELAKKGAGKVNPNPLVGAVIVKDGEIVGEGWHTAYGRPHAEREALAACTADPAGATIYVTLEPCCHEGKQPPCTDALIQAGFARVVIGSADPNPLVAGGGVKRLREAGIEVVEGVCTKECDQLNDAFFHYIKTKRPYVVLKYAMTLDGKIATRTGASRWITSEVARRRVHEDRNRYAAIMVGVNTVIKDDPELTCRLGDFAKAEVGNERGLSEKKRENQLEIETDADQEAIEANLDGSDVSFAELSGSNPIRIICDTHLRTPLDSKLVQSAIEVPTYIATCESSMKKQMPYREWDVEFIVCPEVDGHVDLYALMEKLGARGIDSVIVEGGSGIAWSALAFDVVDKVQCYVAPKLFGGSDAPSPVGGFGVDVPKHAFECGDPKVTQLGRDLLIECEVL
ncbi:MAG: bifunctional diaminohydroxyphosphoribosylaminopyrimidine deaminase/5-amino-6-(5-phosphoribosylamino)uracil reductase RibD [Coriobacteriia bacterium]|nr:bifunctional diaminohydroxyphosphoribosylaminopyrimidine deaminase/5-amino-6-(5-phosphoribosylamino)uracil reductase RibD [Coriobacteriia bacterium]